MATEIRYVTTSDGVGIVYAVSGSGPLLISMPDIGFSSLLLAERELPDVAAWAEALSERFTYVRYDARGFGMSQKNVPDLSLATWHLDLEAVVRALGAQPFVLFGLLGSTRVAVAYAASHPHQVSALVGWPADYPVLPSAEGESLQGLAGSDWETFTETLAHVAMGWENGEGARQLASFWRQTVPHELYLQFLSQFRWPTRQDLLEIGGTLRLPVLALQRRQKYTVKRLALAGAFSDLSLVVLAGTEPLPFHGDRRLVVETIAEFVARQGEVPPSHQTQALSDVLALGAPLAPHMTVRELEVLALLATGKTNSEIAEALVISIRTVERHLMRIYDKVGASGKSARVIAAAHALLRPA